MLLPVFLLPLLACICQYNPYAHLVTTEKPKSADIIGTYALKEQTLIPGGLKNLQGKQTLIELRQDKTFSATDFPLWKSVNTTYALDNMTPLKGNWEIGIVGGVSDIRGEKTVWGIYFRDTKPSLKDMLAASLTNDKPPYGLIFMYGDPDSGTVMIFERVK